MSGKLNTSFETSPTMIQVGYVLDLGVEAVYRLMYRLNALVTVPLLRDFKPVQVQRYDRRQMPHLNLLFKRILEERELGALKLNKFT